MKKKILFVCYGLGIGGIEKCLVNLVNAMPEDRYDVDILLMNPEYTFQDQIRRQVRFINIFDYVVNVHDTVGEIRRRGGFLKAPELTIRYCLFRLILKFGRQPWRVFRPLPDHYDTAIAYSQNDLSAYYVIDKVNASCKAFWYHNGAYERTGWRYERDRRYYPKFDYTVAVSTGCANLLSSHFDFQPGHLIQLKNICDAADITVQADAFVPDSFSADAFHAVTVGRMTREKGPDMAIEACRILRNQGLPICWHWVGDGNQAPTVREKIEEYGLQQHFILEGNQPNPYPYIKNSHVYVQPSRYEAYSTTITEAKILKKPIITTDVGGMRDQLTDGVTGTIAPISADAVADAIVSLYQNPVLCASYSSQLETEDFSPAGALAEYEKTVFS